MFDIHNYEYAIFCRHNGGKEFIIDTYKNFDAAYYRLMDIISRRQELNYKTYVHNDFYENTDLPTIKGCSIYCIKFRQVSNYIVYSKKSESKNEKSNIFYI